HRERLVARPEVAPKDLPPWDEVSQNLDQAIARLSERERTALVLHYFQNRSMREVGTALSISEAAAQKRVNRAVDRLRADFASLGENLSASAIFATLSTHGSHQAPAKAAASIYAAVRDQTLAPHTQ